MGNWIGPLVLLAAVSLLHVAVSRWLHRGGPTDAQAPPARWLINALGTTVAVLVSGYLFDPGLPWLAAISGASSATLSLLTRSWTRQRAD